MDLLCLNAENKFVLRFLGQYPAQGEEQMEETNPIGHFLPTYHAES